MDRLIPIAFGKIEQQEYNIKIQGTWIKKMMEISYKTDKGRVIKDLGVKREYYV